MLVTPRESLSARPTSSLSSHKRRSEIAERYGMRVTEPTTTRSAGLVTRPKAAFVLPSSHNDALNRAPFVAHAAITPQAQLQSQLQSPYTESRVAASAVVVEPPPVAVPMGLGPAFTPRSPTASHPASDENSDVDQNYVDKFSNNQDRRSSQSAGLRSPRPPRRAQSLVKHRKNKSRRSISFSESSASVIGRRHGALGINILQAPRGPKTVAKQQHAGQRSSRSPARSEDLDLGDTGDSIDNSLDSLQSVNVHTASQTRLVDLRMANAKTSSAPFFTWSLLGHLPALSTWLLAIIYCIVFVAVIYVFVSERLKYKAPRFEARLLSYGEVPEHMWRYLPKR